MERRMSPVRAWAERLLSLAASDDYYRRLRLLQWFTAGGVYVLAAFLMYTGIEDGWMERGSLAGWATFVGGGVTFAYVALRTGWSERFGDPSLTQWQIAMGIVAVCWGYLICGPVRTVAMFPLLLIFAFGAFAPEGRKIAALAVFASIGVAGVTSYQALHPSAARDQPDPATLPTDWINLAMSIGLLAALAILAARMSALRASLAAKREALSRALAEVQRLATTDELTGLPNRRSMIDRLVALRDAGAQDVCVAILDIDHFKRINDTLGHAQGDAVLWRLADVAQSVLPSSDVIGRWGGEEFLLLMPGVGTDEACARVEALREAVRGVVVGGTALTFSAGVARLRADEDLSGLVLRADRAMYAVKERGRDGVRLAP
jgi:diguanylate cyclase (GGDEF)-like protein